MVQRDLHLVESLTGSEEVMLSGVCRAVAVSFATNASAGCSGAEAAEMRSITEAVIGRVQELHSRAELQGALAPVSLDSGQWAWRLPANLQASCFCHRCAESLPVSGASLYFRFSTLLEPLTPPQLSSSSATLALSLATNPPQAASAMPTFPCWDGYGETSR